jgi:shikimate 5-dehydrogenase
MDMVYSPAETILLRHARLAGRRGINGRGMLIGQAAESLVRHVCAREIAAKGIDAGHARSVARRAMLAAFGA